MTLSIIGAGLGRTGTLSLKAALEKLGFGPCYHMVEIMENRHDHPPQWQKFSAGERNDWDSIFEGYGSTVDWPACYFWRELADYYPEAKVILSVRDAEAWYQSMRKTLISFMSGPLPPVELGVIHTQLIMANDIIKKRTFDDKLDNKEHVIRTFEAHNRLVQQTLSAERVLVFNVAEGWQPLCEFLGTAVPDEPFPRVNDTQQVLEDRKESMKG